MPLATYHRVARHSQHHHRHHWVSFFLLLVGILALSLTSAKSGLDIVGFLQAFIGSLAMVMVAYAVSLILGIMLGFVTVASPKIESILLPAVDVAQSFPAFAILPFLIYWLGHTPAAIIVVLVIAMIWPITFSVIGGLKEQPPAEHEAATVFGAHGGRRLVHYIWPSLRPQIINGSIIAWGHGWETVIAAEIIAGVLGAGHYLGALGSGGNLQVLALGIFIYLFLIFAINQLFWLPLQYRYTKHTLKP